MGAALHEHVAVDRPVDPRHAHHRCGVRQQVALVADDDRRCRPVDVEHEALRSAARHTEAASLADRDQLDRRHLADRAAGGVDDVTRMKRQPPLQELVATTGGGDEAHVLAVGLAGRAQAELGGHRSQLGLVGEAADGEQRAAQRLPGRACARRSSGPSPGRPLVAAASIHRDGRCVRGGPSPRRRSRAPRRARRGGRTSRAGCTRCTGSVWSRWRGRRRTASRQQRRSPR